MRRKIRDEHSLIFEIGEMQRNTQYTSGRSRQELSNESLVAKIGFDTEENEPLKVRITDHTFDVSHSMSF